MKTKQMEKLILEKLIEFKPPALWQLDLKQMICGNNWNELSVIFDVALSRLEDNNKIWIDDIPNEYGKSFYFVFLNTKKEEE